MAKIQLRVKHKGGQAVVGNLRADSRMAELQEELAKLTQIPITHMKILRGFPPSLVDTSRPSEQHLSECGIMARDTLTVEELKVPVIPEVPKTVRNSHFVPEVGPVGEGLLLRKVVPSDNSCLFSSIGFCLSNGGRERGASSREMRKLVAQAVRSQPDEYSEAVLGRPNADYCRWIRAEDSWGGAIELAVLSAYYGLEIDVVDTQHGLIQKFGEDRCYAHRIMLIYDGIHYDPLFLEPFAGGANRTLFPSSDVSVLHQAQELAAEARSSHQFTDVYRFQLKCLVCQVLLQGQTQAQRHAKETGHASFGEVNPAS